MDRIVHPLRHHRSQVRGRRPRQRSRSYCHSRKKTKEQRRQSKRYEGGNATVKPTLDEELAKFKAIARHIAKHEANHQQADWFKAGSRTKPRRLASLGILSHQPTVVAYCKVTDKERETIIESLLMQKAGSNPESMRMFKEMRKANEENKKSIQHDGDPEMSDDSNPTLPDRGVGARSERASEISLAGVARGGLLEVVGRVERFEDATPETPERVVADPSTTPPPQCQAAHHQNLAVTVMQPQSILIS